MRLVFPHSQFFSFYLHYIFNAIENYIQFQNGCGENLQFLHFSNAIERFSQLNAICMSYFQCSFLFDTRHTDKIPNKWDLFSLRSSHLMLDHWFQTHSLLRISQSKLEWLYLLLSSSFKAPRTYTFAIQWDCSRKPNVYTQCWRVSTKTFHLIQWLAFVLSGICVDFMSSIYVWMWYFQLHYFICKWKCTLIHLCLVGKWFASLLHFAQKIQDISRKVLEIFLMR